MHTSTHFNSSGVLPYRSDIRKYSPGLHQVAILANGPNGAQETANAYFTVECKKCVLLWKDIKLFILFGFRIASLTASCDSTLSSANILSTTCTASSAIKSATCAIDSETPQTCKKNNGSKINSLFQVGMYKNVFTNAFYVRFSHSICRQLSIYHWRV